MRRLIKWSIILGILGFLGWAASGPLGAYMKERKRVIYREAAVSRGKILAAVNSTGTVKPVRSVQVGTFVSGPIVGDIPDFNAEVKKGEVLAQIDPQVYDANVARDKAALVTRKAEVKRVQAELQRAKNDEVRALALKEAGKDFISPAELDQFKYNALSLEAQVTVAMAMVDQAQATLDLSLANQGYTVIKSPVNGIIIDRKVDPGQTVAAQFQTPELFTVAMKLREEIRVFASVDEADIGLIHEAQNTGQPVRFTVDAYPDNLFTGTIFQIRKNSTTTQNVVTYPVLVSAANPDLKLLPGMTASISFQVGEHAKAVRIPNAALRFYPQREQVRPEDRPLLDGTAPANEGQTESPRSANEKAESRQKRNRRHVWIQEGGFLRAIEVIVGLSDSKWTELVSGDIQEGQPLVIGIQPRN